MPASPTRSMLNGEIEKSALHDWVESETRALDLVASWESLCDTYRALEFVDPISDTVRLEEFKWIIKQMNAHLGRARRKLLTCSNASSTREVLEEMFIPTGDVKVTGRMDLAYHKLRQRWVSQMLVQLDMMEAETLERVLETQMNGVENV